jgi:hypothetical protein
VQAVDVLGDDPAKQAEALEPGDRGMTCVRKGPVDGAPSQMAACPVTAAISFRTHEHLVGHRLRAPRPPGRPAIVRDSRLGRDPCAAEYGDVTGPHDINEYVEPGALADRLVNCLSHLSMMRSTCWTSAMARAFGPVRARLALAAHLPRPTRDRRLVAGEPSSDAVLDAVSETVRSILGSDPYLLAGCSYGGYLAAALARRTPAQVAGLLLVCTGTKIQPETRNLSGVRPATPEPGWLDGVPVDLHG